MRIGMVVAALVAVAPPADADMSGLPGVLPLDGSSARVDAAFEHADDSNTIALLATARIALPGAAFVDAELPVGWQEQDGTVALGDATVRVGYRPLRARLAALALRLSAPTAPSAGDGARTAAALAAPRVADGELFLPATTSLELIADWRWNRTTWWLQVEAGAAVWWQPGQRADGVLRASFAAGVPVEPWLDLTASFINRSFALTHDAPEAAIHTLEFGMVTHGGHGQLAIRLEVPIDKSARDDDRFVVGVELRAR